MLLLILKITSSWAGAVCRLKDRTAILKNLVRLEEWSDRSVREFNKIKCKVLHLGRKNHTAQQARPWLPGMQLCGKWLVGGLK